MCGCAAVSPKYEVYSSDSLPLDALSGIIHGPGLGSPSLQRKTPHKLVQGTWKISSQCSPSLLAFCLSNGVIQIKQAWGIQAGSW